MSLDANQLGVVLGALSLVVGLLTIGQGMRRRGLAYRVVAPRRTIVHPDRPSALQVWHKGSRLTDCPVVGVDIALWPSGSESICAEQLRDAIQVSVAGEILEFALTASREQCKAAGVSRAGRKAASGRAAVVVSWDILERGDAILLSLVYARPATAPVRITGYVEGQPAGPRDWDAEMQAPGWRKSAHTALNAGRMAVGWLLVIEIGLALTPRQLATPIAPLRFAAAEALLLLFWLALFFAEQWVTLPPLNLRLLQERSRA